MIGVATSDTRDLPRWRQRTWLIRVTLVAAALAGLLITRRLFWGHPLLAPLPVVDLPPLPGWLARAWWGAMVALLLPSLVRRRADRWLMAFCVLFFARTLWDRATWQPYFLQYGFGLLACALYERDPEGRRTTDPIRVVQLILIATYLWAGLAKIDHTFVRVGVAGIFAPIASWFPVDLLVRAGYLLPVAEIAIAPLLLFRRSRPLGVVMAVGMHLLILAAVGPFGASYQHVIWPWNVAMATLVVLAFIRTAGSSAADVLAPRGRPLQALVLVLFGLCPVLAYLGRWDPYLGLKVYSYRVHRGTVTIARSVAERLPEGAVDAMVRMRGGVEVSYYASIPEWSASELGAYVPPAPANFVTVARRLCATAERPTDVVLTIVDPPDWRTGARGRRRRLTCESL